MYSYQSFAFIGVAIFSNLASGFSCNAPVPPLPTTSAFVRNFRSSPSYRAKHYLGNYNDCQHGDSETLASPYRKHHLITRGGGGTALGASVANGDAAAEGQDLNLTLGKVLSSLWGSCGVVYILAKAIKRVFPIALEPFMKAEGVVPLTQFQLA